MARQNQLICPPMTGGMWGCTAVSQYTESIGYTSRIRIFRKTETDSSQAE
jgi:hypothetical protein